MPDKQPHPEKPEALSKCEVRQVRFRGKDYPAVLQDGKIIGFQCELPRGTGHSDWRKACEAVEG
jgi:hypothetical protein